MRRPVTFVVAAALVLVGTLAVVAARGKDPAGAPPARPDPMAASSSAATRTAPIVRVEPVKVCMVNDRDMQVDQIPVDVEGRTYYGCCPMCKDKLNSDKSVRTAKDPVSGRTVDKSKAVIGRLADGRVLYFESEKTFARFATAPAAR
jgi:YHS domain-containing protein